MRFLLPVAFTIGAALPAAAQQAYTVDELVEFFVQSADLGATRGICIGTPQECAPPVPAGLDMLVTFELDSADLTVEAQANLSLFAQMMQDERLRIASFVVEGHTDALGADAYNVVLSEARAESVRQYLTGLGVAPERLSSVGFGKAKPRSDDPLDPENRRVELRIDLR